MKPKLLKPKDDLFAHLDRLKKDESGPFALPFFSVDELSAQIKKKTPQFAKVATRPNLIFWLRKNGYVYRELHHKGAHLRLWSDIKSYARFRHLVGFREYGFSVEKRPPPENVFEPFFFPKGLPT